MSAPDKLQVFQVVCCLPLTYVSPEERQINFEGFSRHLLELYSEFSALTQAERSSFFNFFFITTTWQEIPHQFTSRHF